MSPIRTGSYAFLILVLLVLAGWGVLQVISAQDEPDKPQQLTREEQEAIYERAVANARSAVEEFVASGANPCSVPLRAPPEAGIDRPYEDLTSLINDVDAIIEGDLGVSSMLMPRPKTAAARITTEFRPRDVLLGGISAETIVIEAGGRVMQSGGELIRFGNPDFDQCSVAHAVLFLQEREGEGVYDVVSQGFATIVDDSIETTRFGNLFAEDVSVNTLKADIQRIAADQQVTEVPRGRLVCESKRDSEITKDPKACPGDSFNPYEAFGLARVLEIAIRKLGDNEVLAARADVPTDTSSVLSMLAMLDRTVSLDPGDDPDGIVISLKVTTTTTGTPPYLAVFEYEAATGTIWLPGSGGRFPAPEGFGEALDALLQGP